MNKHTKVFIVIACLLVCCIIAVRHFLKPPNSITVPEELDTLSFYRNNLPIGSTRGEVTKFLALHPAKNIGRHDLQHPAEGSMSFPLEEIRPPYYCSREISYLRFDFASDLPPRSARTISSEDKLVEINLWEEDQDCL